MVAPLQLAETSLQRLAHPSDAPLLRRLFDESATPLPGLLPEQIALLNDTQYRGREQTYAAQYPDAVDYILCLPDGTAVGRHLIARQAGAYRTIDVAVLREHQNCGLATNSLRCLQAHAAAEGLDIGLRVVKTNPALRLYERLGFVLAGQDYLSVEMLWSPRATGADTSPATPAGSSPTRQASMPMRQPSVALWRPSPKQLAAKLSSISALLIATAFSTVLAAHGQGILTVTPGRSAATTAGTGAANYTGDNGAAASATLASPSAVAIDTKGNVFIADADNHVVREIAKATGTITTVAGIGIAGFLGDGGLASVAQLDTPTGVAVDGSGNLYIADSHNHRIREVFASGNITTVAGTGSAGFAGDGGPATAAELALPSSVAVDAGGSLYIADTNNHKIRKVTAGTITTVAGNGEELFAGDGAAAISASLDLPTGVAVDSAGNVYIADRHNQRIRVVNAAGIISTFAGSGAVTFAGGFSGDGEGPTAALLSKPTGISIDSAGNIFIADTDNQRIRQVSNGTIATVAGSGDQGFGGDSGSAVAAALNAPKTAAVDMSGNVLIADTGSQRLRTAAVPTIVFQSQSVGLPATPQTVTLANTGSAPLVISSVNFSGPFMTASGGSCPASPITIAPGTTCSENLTFVPTQNGASSGAVTFNGTGILPQQILLAGAAAQAVTTVALTSNLATSFPNQTLTFIASVNAPGSPISDGTVTFYDGATALGTATVSSGTASLTTVALSAGLQSITATYAGTSGYIGSTSPAFTELVEDFNLSLTVANSNTATQPGQAVVFNLTAASASGTSNLPVTLSASGLPAGATAIFTPQTLALSSSPSSFQLSIQTPSTTAALSHTNVLTAGMGVFALLLLPFGSSQRRRARSMRLLLRGIVLIAGIGMLAGLSGCGTGSGFFAQQQQSYDITVTGTATGNNGALLQRSTTLTLTIQ